jgi:hypothetical protein
VQTKSNGNCAEAINSLVHESKNPGVKEPPGIANKTTGFFIGLGFGTIGPGIPGTLGA